MKKSLYCFLVILLVISIVPHSSRAQDININNLSSVNVDDLSDDQIQKFIDKVDGSGYTQGQLILMAKSRGMSELQVQKLKSRIDEVNSGGSSKTAVSNASRMRSDNVMSSERPDQEAPQNDLFSDLGAVEEGIDDDKEKIFGHKFFKNSNLTFQPGLNIPTPANYILGPGDEIIIDIWGASEQSYQLMISPEGSIRVPNLGPIYVSGLSVEKAKSKIISRLKRIYSTIGRSSHADVTLGQIRSISVHVIGAVTKPGTYTLSSFGTAFNALYGAGGPTEKGSLRIVEIFRAKKLVSTLDAYAFMIRGTGENITLQDQDVVIVRSIENKVIFKGEVKNEATYEMLDGETMDDLLLYSGGFNNNAYEGVVNLRRIEGNFKTVKSITKENQGSFELFNGDEIFVGKISNEFVGRVTIEGPVLNPGEYELIDGMSLLHLVERADGMKGDAFMNRGVIIRQNSDFSLSSISFDPAMILNGESTVILQNNDLVKFQSIYDLRETYHLVIQGEVQKIGKYAFVKGMTVENLIYLAGGFKESAARSFVEVARRVDPETATDVNKSAELFNFPISKNLALSSEDSNFELKPFDLVVIRKNPFVKKQIVVKIEGEVKYPGSYALSTKEERISSVLKRAGGTTSYAYLDGATLIRRTEYFQVEGEKDNFANDAIRVRKADLTNVFKKDTLFSNEGEIFKQEEAIGIDLAYILAHPGSEGDLILKSGDVVSIPKQLQTVRVRGHVLYPSNIRHAEGKSLKYYVGLAGGFDYKAKKSNAYIIYANGSAARTGSFLFWRNYPKVKAGAEIVIPQKPERQPMSAQAWVALSSSIATLALVITQIIP